MDIKIDEEVIQKTVHEEATKAVARAISGWEVQKKLTDAFAAELGGEVIATAVSKAIENLNHDAMIKAMSETVERVVARGITAVVECAMISVVAKMRGVSEYNNPAGIAAIGKELFGDKE